MKRLQTRMLMSIHCSSRVISQAPDTGKVTVTIHAHVKVPIWNSTDTHIGEIKVASLHGWWFILLHVISNCRSQQEVYHIATGVYTIAEVLGGRCTTRDVSPRRVTTAQAGRPKSDLCSSKIDKFPWVSHLVTVHYNVDSTVASNEIHKCTIVHASNV